MASMSPMWVGTPSASPPIVRKCASVSAHASGLRLATTTLAPAARKPSAIARPIPRVPPVTMATRPVRSWSRWSCSRSMARSLPFLAADLGVAEHLVEGAVDVGAGLAGQAEHPFADAVALHLVGAAGDRRDAAVEVVERRWPSRRPPPLPRAPPGPDRSPCRSGPGSGGTYPSPACRRPRCRGSCPSTSASVRPPAGSSWLWA